MCIRSKHGAITAWCATFDNDSSRHTFPSSEKHQRSQPPPLSAATLKPADCARVYRNIAVYLLLATYCLILPSGVSTAAVAPRSMVPKIDGFNYDASPLSSPFKPPSRKRFKRTAISRPERHPWNPNLVTFVCDKLPDPCQRAAFLRLHTYHDLCSHLPPLYLLPHIDNATEASRRRRRPPKLCESDGNGSRSTDGLYRAYLDSPARCRRSLEALDSKIRSSLKTDLDMFVDVLERSFCILPHNNSLHEECAHCQVRIVHLLVCIILG